MITTRQTIGWMGTAAAAGTTTLLGLAVAASVAAQQPLPAGGTMTERNKAVALRWSEELWSKGQLRPEECVTVIPEEAILAFRRGRGRCKEEKPGVAPI